MWVTWGPMVNSCHKQPPILCQVRVWWHSTHLGIPMKLNNSKLVPKLSALINFLCLSLYMYVLKVFIYINKILSDYKTSISPYFLTSQSWKFIQKPFTGFYSMQYSDCLCNTFYSNVYYLFLWIKVVYLKRLK